MTPSKYQTAIYDFAKNGTNHGVIEAVAGSGKTTTIVNIADKDSLFVAFNKHIAEELKSRGVNAATLNSVGWGACRKAVKTKLDQYKDVNIVASMCDDNRVKWPIAKMISIGKNLMEFNPEYICDNFDVNLKEEHYDLARAAWTRSVNDTHIMSFDDQKFMPVYHDWSIQKVGTVLGDECQDWSKLDQELVCRLGHRIIAVGDRHQSIYQFRGAAQDAVPSLISRLNAIVLPLSVCYRCPRKVVELAKEIVPHIEPGNPKEGEVREERELRPEIGDYVLGRTTAPLVKECLKLIGSGRKATVKGRDIGTGLVDLIRDYDNLDSMMKNLSLIRSKPDLKESMEDRIDTIFELAQRSQTLTDLRNLIERIFTDGNGGVTFCTIHRSKGLENNRIWILGDTRHPKGDPIQEDNLTYVAFTRSKDTLIRVP